MNKMRTQRYAIQFFRFFLFVSFRFWAVRSFTINNYFHEAYHRIAPPLYAATDRPDLSVHFGSETTGQGVNWGEPDDDDDDDDRTHRRQVVADLLADDDKDFKKTRKRKKWGKFANATNPDELEQLLQEERERVLQEHQLKAQLASSSGIEYSILEAPASPNGEVYEESGNVRISAGSSSSTPWFSEMDEELDEEFAQLAGTDNSDTVGVDTKSGKIVAKEALAGVRVGSAGGWMLEVFPGDFIVHRKYGIGRFEKTCLRPKSKLTPEEKEAQSKRRGEILSEELRRLGKGVDINAQVIQSFRAKFGTEEDTDPISNPQVAVLEISYADAVVHVPVERAYRISRYRAGGAAVKPKLSKVRGEAWRNAKQKVEGSTLAMAQDVLALYARRETLKRQPFDPDAEEAVKSFEASFPYEPTSDQLKCFEDVENDMVWKSRPMDRLVCGDVGFGKTEVALRALFRTVANGKQAAFLSPTGVLAAQHYKTILDRMGPETEFGLKTELFRGGMGNTKAGKEARERLANGETQLVVGTHALLSNSVVFKDLGLLVVDEEQRFGVKQKERLKLVCAGVDVLTLSATPIPRTLQMSLSGIRDTSTIRSPPPMRKPTITYVQDFSSEMVKEAIRLELDRGGQCYYVVPRVAMLAEAEEMIRELFPGIRLITAHGRMSRHGAEENVAKFAEGGYDLLLATTVIENGVDIPTVNTIIVQNSQAFGMSSLYQLRGRVGRSDKQAYAYFLHNPDAVTEQASMRLTAIGELNELGSGFDVANRDLEIRGAGSLLGTEQSGMASKVGFDLYMRMLKHSIRKLRGLDLPLVPRTNVLLESPIKPSTFRIPDSFISDAKERKIEESRARLAESTAALVQITNDWKEKYGNLPASLQSHLKSMHLHACTRRLGVDLVGLVETHDEHGTVDCVLRSPGLRPGHWAKVLSLLPRGATPKGFDVMFPARFTLSGVDEEFEGGKKLNLKQLLEDESLSEQRDEEEWDAMDKEEEIAIKDIASAMNVKTMKEIDLEQYPRFVIRDFGADDSKAVDRLLKMLLPISKIVYEQQAKQAEDAKTASALREKQETLRTRKRKNDADSARRMGYDMNGL